VRLTLDSSLQLVKETAPPVGSPDWCKPLSERVEEAAVLRRFPHAILEVKLATDDEPPAWLSSLLASGLAEEVPKFSKYLTGCAVHHRASLNMIPDWFAQPSLQTFVSPTAGSSGGVTAAPRPLAARPASGEASTRAPLQVVTASATALPMAPLDGVSKPAARRLPRVRLGGSAPVASKTSAPATMRLVDRTNRRADPKIYFANERTFIQWLSAGLMMTSIGIATIEFKAAQLRPPLYAQAEAVDPVTGQSLAPIQMYTGTVQDYLGGILICSLSLCIIMYGLGVYLIRLRKLKRCDSSGYDDKYGPIVLVAAVVASLCVYISVHIGASIESNRMPTVTLDAND